MAKKANRTRQEFIEDTLGDIRYKDYKSPLDSFNEQLNDNNNANDSATTAIAIYRQMILLVIFSVSL